MAQVLKAHTLPNNHSPSNVSRENTLENMPKITQLYPIPDFGKGRESSE